MLPGSRVPRSEAEAAAAATASTSVSPPFSPSRSPQAHLRRPRRRSLASLLAESEAESEATHGGEGREVVGQLLPASLPALRPSGAPHRPGGGEGASEFRRRCEMDVVCEVCGDVGYRHLLVQCNSCKNATRHRYCMNQVIYDGSSIEWSCDDCDPKYNEVAESLKWRCEGHHSIQLGSSRIDEPNMNRVEVTMEPWSWGRRRNRLHKAGRHFTWGRRRNRSRMARRENTDACTKHFPSGTTFNYPEMFVEEKSKRDDVKEGENLGLAMECLGLSKEKDSCSLSLNYVEVTIPRGSKADLLPLISDVERSHPFAMDNSWRTLPIVMLEDGSSPAAESVEQFHPLEVVNPDGSSHSPLDPGLETEEQGTDAGLFASVNDAEQSDPSFTDESSHTLSSEEHVGDSSPTSESWEQPEPLEVVKPWDDVPKSILGSKPVSNYSQPMQASDPDVGNMDVLDPSKECLDSRAMSKTVDSSSFSNGGDSTVEKDHADRTECLSGMETVAPALDNVQGSSPLTEPSSSPNGGDLAIRKNSAERTECLSGTETVGPALDNVQGSSTSTAKECLVSDVDNLDEANRSDKHFLCTTENKEGGQLEVPSHLNVLNAEVHCSHNDINGSSSPKSGLGGRNTQNDLPKASLSAGKNVVCSQVSQMEDVNREVLPSKNVSPCKATKGSFKRPNSHTQGHIKHQKTNLIMEDRNADPARQKSSRPSQQLDHTCLSTSLELSSKAKEVNDANDSEPRCSGSARTFENVVPMKRKRLILPHKEDAETMQVEDSNPPSSENDGEVMRHVESGAMNQRRTAKNHEVSCPGNSNNQHVNIHTQTKKRRRAKKDKKAPLGNPSVRCAPNGAEQLASEAAVLAEGCCGLTRMPVISEPTDKQPFICPQPTDRSCWTGIIKIGQEYIYLAAHLSNQACKKVRELSLSLPPVMKVTKHSKLKAWPSRWEASELTSESIGLYFFSDNMRPNKELDRLVQYVADHNIVLKYVFGLSKLLIFSSVLLPEQCQTLQGKHYLWGVFRRRSGRSKAASQAKQKVSTSHATEKKDHQDKVQDDTQDQERPVSKVQSNTQDQEIPVSKGTIPSEGQPSPGDVHDVGTEVDPSGHRKPANSEALPTKLIVVAQTPRSEQFIKELENEGALVFAVKGLMKPGIVRLSASNAVGPELTSDNDGPAS
ncbi:unnamed protein product [Urochloa decumbens]|uniref:AIPP2-like SPOC-like domain-containing protein n=1 Tax=Urochloa decumbens TaxID=240449 RepID=A0ABC9H209_9POAL